MKMLQNSLILALCLVLAGCWIRKSEPKFKPSTTSESAVVQILPQPSEQNLTKAVKIEGQMNAKFANLAQKYRQNGALAVRFFGDSHIASDDLLAGFREEFFGEHAQNAVGSAYAAMPKYHNNGYLKYKTSDFAVLNSQNDKFDDYPLCGVVAKAEKKGATIMLDTRNLAQNEWEFELKFKAAHAGEALHVVGANFERKFSAQKGSWQRVRMRLKMPVLIRVLQKDLLLGGYHISTPNARFIDHCGINGAKAGLWRKWRVQDFSDLGVLKYDLIVLEYGTNDAFDETSEPAKFEADMRGLIKNIRQNLPNVPILILSPPPTEKPKFKAIWRILRQVATDEDAWLYDMDAFVRENGGKQAWIEQNLSKKDVHLTSQGYKKIGKALAVELKNMLK